MLHHGKHAPVPAILRHVAGIKWAHFEHKIKKILRLNICYVLYVLLWIKYWLMWFESLFVFILFKFKKRPNISGIRVVSLVDFKLLNVHPGRQPSATEMNGNGSLLVSWHNLNQFNPPCRNTNSKREQTERCIVKNQKEKHNYVS